MTEDNERLLEQFFSEAARQQVADDGFSQRVMQALPERERPAVSLRRFNRLWTLFCVTVFAVLFVVFHGWELLAVHFLTMLRTLLAQPFTVNLTMLASVLFGLLFVGVGEVIQSNR